MLGQFQDRNFGEVDFLGARQREQYVERTLESVEIENEGVFTLPALKIPFFRLGRRDCRRHFRKALGLFVHFVFSQNPGPPTAIHSAS